MNSEIEHPSKEVLQNFALGKLPEESIERISSHLESCETCNLFLDQNFDDTLSDRLNHHQSDSKEQDFILQSTQPEISFEQLREIFESKTKYSLEKTLGSGGMGTVYLAYHRVMDRKVAIKVVKQRILADPQAIKRFEIETRSAAQLSHPNIVAAYDADQVDGIHFLVMEFVDGESLAEILKRKGPLSVRRACNYIYQVAVGLRHAHSHSMIHRDIKPQNIMKAKNGRIKILDFGLARLQASEMPDQHLTQSGVMMGTANYVAPEQARDGRNADIRSDLYSLGCTLFTLLSGKVPFPKGTYMEKVLAHCTESFPSISKVRDDVPSNISQIISKLTAKKPDERYGNPKELIDDLEPIVKAESGNNAETHNNVPVDETVVGHVSPMNSTGLSIGEPEKDVGLSQVDTKMDRSKRILRRSLLAFLASALLLFASWLFYDLVNGSGRGEKSSPLEQGENQNGLLVDSGEKKKILVFLNRQKFWYGDLGPLITEMENHKLQLYTIAVEKGFAKVDNGDTTEGAKDVQVDFDFSNLDQKDFISGFDAIVFIGNSVQDFVNVPDNRPSLQATIGKAKGKSWIVGIGKGMSVPLYYHAFDKVSISRSRWIQGRFYEGRNPILEDQSVVVDLKNKVLTCSDWTKSQEAAKRLAELLLESK